MSPRISIIGLVLAPLVCGAAFAQQDYSVLRINEVLASHAAAGPVDVTGGTPDIIEIYNSGDATLDLGFANDGASIGLSDTLALPETALWVFGAGVRIRPGESVLVFCDGNTCEGECEPHASFQIDSDGQEPITLWGPEDGDGNRTIIDQVWLPPLSPDVSFGRSPDGAGPAPVPITETFDHFVFFPVGETSLGGCFSIPNTTCALTCTGGEGLRRRFCEGNENGSGGNLEPRVFRRFHSTNSPAAGEAVEFVVEVRDDELPIPGNIASVEIVYRVDGGAELSTPMVYDDVTGVQPDLAGLSPGDPDFPLAPLDRRSQWRGAIPGQAAGAVVQFYFRVTDVDGLSSTRPRDLCPDGVGPCGENFGGPGCEFDPDSTSCDGALTGVRYVPCDAPFRYVSGYESPIALDGLVFNEIMASQSTVARDPSSRPTSMYCTGDDPPSYCCFGSGGDPAPADCGFEDFVEIYNGSANPVDLGGLWLSSSVFDPRGWSFPEGAILGAGEYAIVWLDEDGGKCPDPGLPVDERPCFWECPDPQSPEENRYHASFTLDADGDELYLFDRESTGFGRILGVDLPPQTSDVSWSLCPNGDPAGTYRATPDPTFRADNSASAGCSSSEPTFRRGDATADGGVDITDAVFVLNWLFLGGASPRCADAADTDDSGSVDISDAVSILNYLFLGGPAPRAPGPDEPGIDPVPDDLAECVYEP